MYSSLHKLDLGYRPRGSDVAILMQTDHRDALAICDAAALSVVFAVTRCLTARAHGQADPALQPFRVVYQLDAEPPAFFAYAVAAAGAALVRGDVIAVPEPADPRANDLIALVDDACARIAAAAGSEPTVAGLAAYERALVVGEDEHAYYAAIVTLGALAAAVARAKLPTAVWRMSTDVVPFALAPPGAADAMQLPVFALAQRYVDGVRAGHRDATDAPSLLLGIMFGEITSITL